MDPNETLQDIRDVLKRFRDKQAGILDLEDLAWAIQQFQNLDEWLSKGGFPPGKWISKNWERD